MEGSPTCGAVKTHIRDKKGESVSVKEPGIFFEEFKKALRKNSLAIKIYDWDIQGNKFIVDPSNRIFVTTN